MDFNESGLHVDVVVPVISSCGPRERQRAALGSRRPRRTDRERKDRRTPPSWVSGTRVAGAPSLLPRRAHSPRRRLPRPPLLGPSPWLPGSAAVGESPLGLGHFRGGTRSRCPPGLPRPPPAVHADAAGGGGAPRRASSRHLPGLCGFGKHQSGGAVRRAGARRGPRWHEQDSPRPL